MLRWSGVFLLALLAPTLARAQEEPERLLPATTQIYLRWDGIEAHRADYAKTALGKTLEGDTGKFITSTFGQLQNTLGAMLTSEQLLQGVPQDKLQKILADAAEAPKLLGLIGKRGFLLGVEMRGVVPPQAQLTFIIPGAGKETGPLFGTVRLAAVLGGTDIKEVKVGNRTVYHLGADPVHLVWWAEGPHAVLAFGTDTPEAVVKRATAKDTRLVDSPLYKRVNGFKQFTTAARGYFDVAGLVKVIKSGPSGLDKIMDDLGLNGVHSVVFYSGFAGDAERGLIEMDVAKERKGLLKGLATKPFTLADAPPLPNDVISWSMTNVDLASLYDVSILTVTNIAQLIEPNSVGQIKEGVKKIDEVLGVKLRDDLLASMGPRFATYNSPAEGPLTLGQTFLFEAKDPKKLEDALDQAVKGIARASNLDMTVKKTKYHGADIREVHVRQEGFIFVPSYAIYKGWLVVAFYPQAVQGFVLRANGELPVWAPDERVKQSLEQLPKECVSISVSDPRPTVKQILSLAPIIAQLVNSLTRDTKVDVGALPNAHEATRYLFPNVSVVTDTGTMIRAESRSSLELPFDLTGADTYGLLFLAFFAARGF